MSRDDALVLDIVLAADDAQSFVQGMDFTTFETSRLHQNAVIRSLEIIGEAAGKISAEFTSAHPDLPWRNIANMRHRLIHAYNEVRLDIVWAVIEDDLPQLIATLKPLILSSGQIP
jgi:uncharacterized protein with HEPN domain